MVTVLRPLSTSELLDRTFHLYRNNFLVFVGITAIPQLFVLALRVAVRVRPDANQVGEFFLAYFGIWIVSFIAIETSHAWTVMAVSNLQLGRPAGVGSAYRSVQNSLLRVIWISFAVLCIPILFAVPVMIVVGIIVGIAGGIAGGGFNNVAMIRVASLSLVLIVPLIALRWWLAWSLVVPVTVLEGGGLRVSMRRSKTLTKGCRGRIFVIYLLIAILVAVVSWMIQLPLLAVVGLRSLREPGSMTAAALAISAVGAFLSTSLVGALGTIALTLIYYDQRVRKEGFDLQLMMSTLEGGGQAAAAAPVGATGV
jgi:hypothetical protein